jgi:hypothetical protein
MRSDIKCSFCRATLDVASYLDHIVRDCDSLSVVEKNRAQEAAEKLLCECRICRYYVYTKRYEHHREERHPKNPALEIIEPYFSCYCPFSFGISFGDDLPFSRYEDHILKNCPGYITFIAAHCRPPKDWPHAEVDRLNYWLRLLKERRDSRATPDEPKGGNSGPSIWVTFVQGGLCNGR